MLRLVKVHENVHLIEQCIDLLNDEWPREKATRMKTLQKSTNDFPLCLVLVDENEAVIGFVKLSSERPFNMNIFLESLIVSKANRSKGFGRFIMSQVEQIVKSSGYGRITLTTTDKEAFYLKMGFKRLFDKLPNQANQQTFPTCQLPPPPVPPLMSITNSRPILMFKDI